MQIISRSFRLLLFVTLSGLIFIFSACNSTSVGGVSITDRSNPITIASKQIGSVTASCQQGEQMVSGGYGVAAEAYLQPINSVAYPLDLYPVIASYPSSPTSWTVTVRNRSSSSTTVTAHVECVSTSVGIQLANALGDIDSSQVTASCPQGTQRTGGGWQVSNIYEVSAIGVVTILNSSATGPNNWSVSARLAEGSTGDPQNDHVTSYVVCAANTLTMAPGASSQVAAAPAPPGVANIATPGAGRASCGSNQLLTGAGFSMNDIAGNLGLVSSFPSYDLSPAEWVLSIISLPLSGTEGGMYNNGGTGAIVPICATLT